MHGYLKPEKGNKQATHAARGTGMASHDSKELGDTPQAPSELWLVWSLVHQTRGSEMASHYSIELGDTHRMGPLDISSSCSHS